MTTNTLSMNSSIFGDTYMYVGSKRLNEWHAQQAAEQRRAARAKAQQRQQLREREELELSALDTARADHWFQIGARRQPAAQGTAGMAWMDHWAKDEAKPMARPATAAAEPTGLRARWAALASRWASARAEAELRRLTAQDPRVMRDLQVMSDLAEWNPALR